MCVWGVGWGRCYRGCYDIGEKKFDVKFDVTVFDVTVFDVPVFDVNSSFLLIDSRVLVVS